MRALVLGFLAAVVLGGVASAGSCPVERMTLVGDGDGFRVSRALVGEKGGESRMVFEGDIGGRRYAIEIDVVPQMSGAYVSREGSADPAGIAVKRNRQLSWPEGRVISVVGGPLVGDWRARCP